MNEPLLKNITLKHLLIDDKKQIGLQFYPDKVIQALVKQLPNAKWSNEFNMVYFENTKSNLDAIFDIFRGVAWINGNYFFKDRPLQNDNGPLDIEGYRNRKLTTNYRPCPEEFFQKLEVKKYSLNTAKAYIGHFEAFINSISNKDLLKINEMDINDYLSSLVKKKFSDSYINLAINSIKFYYEIVLGMPNRFYEVDRPRKVEKLPVVLSKEEVSKLIGSYRNIKHRCIAGLLYSSGLRLNELLNLEIADIDSDRMLIRVVGAKGNKDRYTILSEAFLGDLRKYYLTYKPMKYLFESPYGDKYGGTSVQKLIKRAAKSVGIRKKVTPHTLRHSFATHLLEDGTDLRYIQNLLGHNSSRTTEIYTHVAINKIKGIKSPLDSLSLVVNI